MSGGGATCEIPWRDAFDIWYIADLDGGILQAYLGAHELHEVKVIDKGFG